MFLSELVLAFALAVMLCAIDTPLGRMMRHALVEAPARALDHFSLQGAIVVMLVFLILFGIAGGPAFGAPDWFAVFAFGDLSFYVEAAVLTMLTRTVLRVVIVKARVMHSVHRIAACTRRGLARVRARRRAAHTRRHKTPPPSDDDPLAWARRFGAITPAA